MYLWFTSLFGSLKEMKQILVTDFKEDTGPTIAIPETPFEIFNLFFTDDFFQLLVSETNRYSKEVLGDMSEKWQLTTIEEIKAYLGFHLLKGINVLPSDDDYWKRDSHLYYHPIASRISRDRFRELNRYFHFVDNATVPVRGSPLFDRLGKVRPVIEHLSKRFRDVYHPDKDLAVDDQISRTVNLETVHASQASQTRNQGLGFSRE